MFILISCFNTKNNLGFDANPSVTETAQANLTSMECGLPTLLSFTARELADGTLFKAIEDYDPDSKRMLHQLKKYVPFAAISIGSSIITCWLFVNLSKKKIGYNMPTVFCRLYHNDPVFNPLTPWERPPIKNVFCIYGSHLKTEV